MRAEPRHERHMAAWVRVTVTILVIAVLGVAALGYYAMGWQRMVTACSAEGAQPLEASTASVAFSWTWEPLGFTCTWPGEAGGDPVEITRLWW